MDFKKLSKVVDARVAGAAEVGSSKGVDVVAYNWRGSWYNVDWDEVCPDEGDLRDMCAEMKGNTESLEKNIRKAVACLKKTVELEYADSIPIIDICAGRKRVYRIVGCSKDTAENMEEYAGGDMLAAVGKVDRYVPIPFYDGEE